jgi:hypothetical protein
MKISFISFLGTKKCKIHHLQIRGRMIQYIKNDENFSTIFTLVIGL